MTEHWISAGEMAYLADMKRGEELARDFYDGVEAEMTDDADVAVVVRFTWDQIDHGADVTVEAGTWDFETGSVERFLESIG